MFGGCWRVDIIPGRYGWYARAVPLRRRAKRARAGTDQKERTLPHSLGGEAVHVAPIYGVLHLDNHVLGAE